MENKKVLLSIKDLVVKFRVRGRVLTAIRGIDLDIYEEESIAIVGESGSGKSVFTKTFAGMLDSNGFIDKGHIIFYDDELADTCVKKHRIQGLFLKYDIKKLNKYSGFEFGTDVFKKMTELDSDRRAREGLEGEEINAFDERIKEIKNKRAELYNKRQTYEPKLEKDKIKEATAELKALASQLKQEIKNKEKAIAGKKKALARDKAYNDEFAKKKLKLRSDYVKLISQPISDEVKARNVILAKEIYLSIGRYPLNKRLSLNKGLLNALKKAMLFGVDLNDDKMRSKVFDEIAFRVKYLDEDAEKLHGVCVLNLGNVKFSKDWSLIRGGKIATVFQDPMTSLNPILTIGKQITSIILKHQDCSEAEARLRALELMKKVGIPNAENRFDDYPFQYSGGMRQRIVIAIALSCQPKILICDEPTTALDVTIQAQILKLIKDLQKEFHYTIVFITHDLGVVANIADRVAVMYAGQIVELGTVEEIFYDPRHPYTWALLSSLPQLAEKNTRLFSITGTPPSLYNSITGDAFAPRSEYCMKIDTLMEPPMFQVSDTHFAKTWLLDPKAPKISKPEGIENIHEKLINAFNI